ncbi:MAG TPA: flagellar hook-length control protein FliK [Nitrospinota bacterium]|nr:flagellar hook-length control protein FliK [Nitrospinota bacterium]
MLNIPILSSVIPSVNNTIDSGVDGAKEENSSFFQILQNINSEQVKNISQFMKKASEENSGENEYNLQKDGLGQKNLIEVIFQQNPLMLKELFNYLKEGGDISSPIKGSEDKEVLNLIEEVFFLNSGLKETEITELTDKIFNDSKGFLGKEQHLGTKDLVDLKGIQENLEKLLIKESFVSVENRKNQGTIEKSLQELKIADENIRQEITNFMERKEGLSLKDLLIRIGVLSDKEEINLPVKEFFNQKDSIFYKEGLVKIEEPSLGNKSAGLIEDALDGKKQIFQKELLDKGSIYIERDIEMAKKPIQAFDLFEGRLDIDPKAISSIKEIIFKGAGTGFEQEFQNNDFSMISELEIKSERIDPLNLHHKDVDLGLLHKEGSLGETKEALGKFVNEEITNKSLFDNQILDQIIDKVKKPIFKNGINEIKLSLKPEFLGELKIEISVEKNVFKADITVENHFIKDVLDGNLEKLKQALHTHGLEIREFSVSVGQDHDKQATNHNGSNNSKAAFDFPKEELAEEKNNIHSNMITQNGLIDIVV